MTGLFLLMLITAGLIAVYAYVGLPKRISRVARGAATRCSSNMRAMGLGMGIYVDDWDRTLPLAENWCDALAGYQVAPLHHDCPLGPATADGASSDYSFNTRNAARPLADFRFAYQAPVIFESTNSEWNSYDELTSFSLRHKLSAAGTFAGGQAVYADGHAEAKSQMNATDGQRP